MKVSAGLTGPVTPADALMKHLVLDQSMVEPGLIHATR